MSKLGPHFIGGENTQKWIDAGTQDLKFDPTSLGRSSLVPPGPLVIGKLDQQDNALSLTDWKAMMKKGVTPQNAAGYAFVAQQKVYVSPNKPYVDRYAINSRIDVWETDNEVVPDSPEEARWFALYCIESMKWFESIGKKRAIFSFAVGTPDINPGYGGDIWPHLLPAVRYAHDKGHYIALHEYMGYSADYGVGWLQVDENRKPLRHWHGRIDANNDPVENYPYGWTTLRYRYIYDAYFGPSGLQATKLLITELGCDSVPSVTPAGFPVGTWKELSPAWASAGFLPESRYADMLTWYDKAIQEDSFVRGATVFTVGSIGIWEKWDIANTDVEDKLLGHIRNSLPDTPPPIDPPQENEMNKLINGSFEGEWKDATKFYGHIPAGWDVRYVTDQPNPFNQRGGTPYQNGEAVKKHRGMLPAHEQSIFVWDGDWTYKIFGGGVKTFWFEMEQAVHLDAGRYKLRTPVWVDHYHPLPNNGKDFNVDPNQAQISIWVNDDNILTWKSLQSGRRHDHEIEFDWEGGLAHIDVSFRSNWAINGNFWVDGLSLEPVTVTPPIPPTTRHKAIIVKVPQDVSQLEWLSAATYALKFRHTMTASHDDMLSLLRAGRPDSYVKIAYPEKQPDLQQIIEAAGYKWQAIPAAELSPAVANKFDSPVGTREERERGDLWD